MDTNITVTAMQDALRLASRNPAAANRLGGGAVPPLFTFTHAGKHGAFYAPDMVVWGGMGFQLSAIRCPKLLAAVQAAKKGGAA